MATVKKKLYKSKTNRVLKGVLGGIGEYFDVDPVVIRVAFVLITAFTHVVPGIVAYIVASFVMPEK
jgi:phage shock protein C